MNKKDLEDFKIVSKSIKDKSMTKTYLKKEKKILEESINKYSKLSESLTIDINKYFNIC